MGIIFDIQRCSLQDGPGIRTTVFLKGCPLRCLWCHNPESWESKKQIMLAQSMCIQCRECALVCKNGCHEFSGEHGYNSGRCIQCGACVKVCGTGALKFVGDNKTAAEVMDVVLKDSRYYADDGGVTVSGGEPLLQSAFVCEIFCMAKENHIHTALETSGYGKREDILRIAEVCDLFLYDYKATGRKEHKRLTGVDNRIILENLYALWQAGSSVILRCPVVPGQNDNQEHFHEIAEIYKKYPNIQSIEILGYHDFAKSKNAGLGNISAQPYFEVPDSKLKDKWLSALTGEGVDKALVR